MFRWHSGRTAALTGHRSAPSWLTSASRRHGFVDDVLRPAQNLQQVRACFEYGEHALRPATRPLPGSPALALLVFSSPQPPHRRSIHSECGPAALDEHQLGGPPHSSKEFRQPSGLDHVVDTVYPDVGLIPRAPICCQDGECSVPLIQVACAR